jgi:hypothetical protein
MSTRRTFLKNIAYSAALIPISDLVIAGINDNSKYPYPRHHISDLCKHIKPVGRILETEGYYVWCNSPIYGPDGKVHVFYSRWPDKYGMGGWINKCEIAHAVAQTPESPFEYVDTVLSPREGFFDATTCHNPHIKWVDGKFCLFYMGNSNGKTNTKRIGLATSHSLYGPWEKPDKPLLEAGAPGAWDDHCTTNPAFLKHPNGQYWLYYKSWNTHEYETAPKDAAIKGNRKYGLAIADKMEGPYIKYSGNPVIDFSQHGQNKQLEDAFVWYDNKRFKLIARDMGFFDHNAGLFLESKNGIHWKSPEIAYCGVSFYVNEPPAPKHLKRYGRFERPQLLINDNKPQYIFTASQGGKYGTASGFVLKIE